MKALFVLVFLGIATANAGIIPPSAETQSSEEDRNPARPTVDDSKIALDPQISVDTYPSAETPQDPSRWKRQWGGFGIGGAGSGSQSSAQSFGGGGGYGDRPGGGFGGGVGGYGGGFGGSSAQSASSAFGAGGGGGYWG